MFLQNGYSKEEINKAMRNSKRRKMKVDEVKEYKGVASVSYFGKCARKGLEDY